MLNIGSPVPIKLTVKYKLKRNEFKTYGVKIGRNVALYSEEQYEYFVLLDSDPKVAAYCEKPHEIDEYLEGVRIKLKLDMWVRMIDNTTKLVIVLDDETPAVMGKNGPEPRHWELLQKWARYHTEILEYVSNEDLEHRRSEIEVWKELLPRVHQAELTPNYQVRDELIRIVGTRQDALVADMEHALAAYDPEQIYNQISWLIFSGKIQADFSKHSFTRALPLVAAYVR